MIGYTPAWNAIITEMFGNSVGTSMDFPNLYRCARAASMRAAGSRSATAGC